MTRRLRTATILGAASVLASLGAAGVGRLAPVPAAGAAPPASVTALVAWGDNSTGELGNGTTSNADTPMTVSLPAGVVPDAVAGGGGGLDGIPAEYAGYAIGSDKKLYAWGDNSTGQLGDGSTTPTSSDTPVVVALPSGVTPVAISAAQGAAYAIGSDGNLYAWGDGGLDKLGDGSMTSTDTPVLVSLPTGVTAKAVAAGYESAYAVGSDGNLYAWGDNVYGELGNGNTNDSDTPVVVSLPAGVKPLTIAGGGGVGYAIGSDSNLYSWGLNTGDELGDGSSSGPQSCMGNSCSDTPVLVSLPAGVTAKAITGGGGFAHAIGSDGNLYGWGSGSGGQLGVTDTTPTPLLVTLAPGVTPTAISDNLQTGYAIGSDGNVYAWGYGADGERGNGSTASGSPPVVVSLPPGSVPLSLGPEPGSSAGYAIVSAPPTAPLVTSQPQPQTVFVGQSATFTAAAGGFPAPSVQWQVSTDGGATFAPVSGGTSHTLTVATTTIGQNGDEYDAVFSNGTAPDATTNPALTDREPRRRTVHHPPTDRPDRHTRRHRQLHGRGRRVPRAFRAVAGLDRRWRHLRARLGWHERHPDRRHHDDRSERGRVRGGVHQRGQLGNDRSGHPQRYPQRRPGRDHQSSESNGLLRRHTDLLGGGERNPDPERALAIVGRRRIHLDGSAGSDR